MTDAAVNDDKVRIRPDTSGYVAGRSATGSKTMHNGDIVAEALDGCTLEEVKEIAEAMGIDEVNKYDHLNVGQRRMNLGNRLRGAVQRQTKAHEEVLAAADKDDATKAEIAAAKKSLDGPDTLAKVMIPFRKAVDARRKEAEKAKAASKAASK